jgi:hypothetical protein
MGPKGAKAQTSMYSSTVPGRLPTYTVVMPSLLLLLPAGQGAGVKEKGRTGCQVLD